MSADVTGTPRSRWYLVGGLTIAALLGLLAVKGEAFLKVLAHGETRALRQRSESAPAASQLDRPKLLILALDGVGRKLLYDQLEKGRLPGLTKLLHGKADKALYKNHSMLSALPSTTMVAWASAFTGRTPAHHGMAGNEFFIRQTRTFAAPAPVTIDDPELPLKNYTENYAGGFLRVPTVYELMRQHDPHVSIWVAAHPIHTGADRILTASRAVFIDAFSAKVEEALKEAASSRTASTLYASLDGEVVDTVVDELESSPLPDVLTVYLVGIDAFAHAARQGPDTARSEYLVEVLDPLFSDLAAALSEAGDSNRYTVVTSDHGHTEVLSNDLNSLSFGEPDEPTAALKDAGFRVRPMKHRVPADHDFSAVVAYQGAFGYFYLADRSTCPKAGEACDWKKPPRYEQDVLAAAEALHRSNRTGAPVSALRGTIDAIIVRSPRGYGVYEGASDLTSFQAFSKRKGDVYTQFTERIEQLVNGPAADRAGDLIVLAHNGDRDRPEHRYVFSAPGYHSWHGSPSPRDSEIALIISHPSRASALTGRLIKPLLGGGPYQHKLTDILLALRYGVRPWAELPKDR